MMNFLRFAGGFCAASAFVWGPVAGADEHPRPAVSLDFQLQRLLTPTPAELQAEQEGSVYIYDSLEIGQVDEALDRHFERIQNMMFIRIHHLPPTAAGPADVEDDGCD
jgi:hypothetical protein